MGAFTFNGVHNLKDLKRVSELVQSGEKMEYMLGFELGKKAHIKEVMDQYRLQFCDDGAGAKGSASSTDED
eukprot:7967784-Karenia_brevis.AAC.1